MDASVVPVESCAVCHGDGAFADASANHFVGDQGAFDSFAVTPDGADLVVSFAAEVDGAPATTAEFYRSYAWDGTTRTSLTSEIEADLANLFTNNGDGTYSIRIVDGVARFGATNHRYLAILRFGDNALEIAATGDYPDAIPLAGLASVQSCQNCHGASGEEGRFAPDNRGGHYSAPLSVDACVVCHRPGASYGDLPYVVHGIHNSHNFPDGVFGPTGRDTIYDVTYPTYMTNCSVCHSDDNVVPATGGSALAAANAMPVTGAGCFTCHGSMESWEFSDAFAFHYGYDETTNCQQCHTSPGGIAFATVADAHNGLTTERGGIIWDGVDTSVTEGALIDWQITGVADDGVDLTITWQATYDGVGVDPCNATAGAGAPVFFADGDGNLSILRNYAQGGDFILGTNPDSAGQPGSSPGVSADNTTCEGNVATTVVPVEETDAMYGRVAIQGKPRLPSVADATALMAVRAKTPTFDWVIGEGGAAPERRAVVDTAECLKCHVGSLYQHGGNRVDNVDMCYLCHNPAANDEYVRAGMGVDESEAYDGKPGQSFGIKEMLHAVHSAGETTAPIVIYRNRGIYAWAGDVSQIPNWPGSGRNIVFGSDDFETNHTFHSPTYPRTLNACGACHSAEFARIFPDATKAMATTVAAGEEPFGNQLDDVLEGVNASSCMTCHRSGDTTEEAGLKAHAHQNGWVPQTFEEGRKTIIEAND